MSVRRQKRTGKNGQVREFWIVDIEHRDINGTPVRIRKVPRRQTRVAAEKLEREILESLSAGTFNKNSAVPTVAQFTQTWLEHAATHNKPSTQVAKEYLTRLHVVPYFGHRKLNELTVLDVEKYKAHKLAQRGLHKHTINYQLTALRTMLRTAVEWEIVKAADIPAVKLFKRDDVVVEFLGFDEAERLVAAAEGTWRAMITLALNTGLRLGELLALRWEDVDLVAGRLAVRKSRWKKHVGTPKGGRSRELPLNGKARAALKAHKHLRGPLVFCKDDGVHLTQKKCHAEMVRWCRRAGIKGVQWHALRHTFASHLVMRGVSLKAVQELLGHRSIQETQKYAHLAPGFTEGSVAVLDDLQRQPAGNTIGGTMKM